MTEYTFKTQKVYEDESIDLPDNAREVEYEFGQDRPFDDSELGWHAVPWVRVMWLEKKGKSVQ